MDRYAIENSKFVHIRSGGNFISSSLTNLFALCVIFGLLAFVIWSAEDLSTPMSQAFVYTHVSLDYSQLPYYALCTSLRLWIGIIFSMMFSIIYATLAAKSERLGSVLIPLLDVLQSIPILGYISFTFTLFMALFPRSVMGIEMGAIFAIFTSQVWNIALSFYQSLMSVPTELSEAAVTFKLTKWQKFWRLEVPYAIPGLIWNASVSMASGWFFIVASEVIAVGNNVVELPGIGSYISHAIAQKQIHHIYAAIGVMCIVIYSSTKLILDPINVWADKFKCESQQIGELPKSWIFDLLKSSSIMNFIVNKMYSLARIILSIPSPMAKIEFKTSKVTTVDKVLSAVWYGFLLFIVFTTIDHIYSFLHLSISISDLHEVLTLTFITFVRVIVMIAIISVILIPLGIYIGLRPKIRRFMQPIIQFLASFPANLFFPLAVMLIDEYDLSPNIWLSPLLVVGAMWYVLFNVIAGASQISSEHQDVCSIFSIKGILKWKKVLLPAVMPFYITGAITAAGGAWNATIVSEIVSWGDKLIIADGIGSYIAQKTSANDLQHVMLGIIVLTLLVIVINKIFWHPLYQYISQKYR